MLNREQIAQEALALPPEDRTYLADVLEQSLTSGEFATSEIAAEWSAEIDRRIAAYDRGETAAVDAKVLSVGKDRKVIAFKFKRKTNYHRTIGHRQTYTRVKIGSLGGKA